MIHKNKIKKTGQENKEARLKVKTKRQVPIRRSLRLQDFVKN